MKHQRYGTNTYPDLKKLSAAILEKCPKGAQAPIDLKSALLLVCDTISLRKEIRQTKAYEGDKGHDDWLATLSLVRATLERIQTNTKDLSPSTESTTVPRNEEGQDVGDATGTSDVLTTSTSQPRPNLSGQSEGSAAGNGNDKLQELCQYQPTHDSGPITMLDSIPDGFTAHPVEHALPWVTRARSSALDNFRKETLSSAGLAASQIDLLFLLRSYSSIENFVLETWAEVSEGQLPLSVAMDVTLCATGLVERGAQRYLQEFGDLDVMNTWASLKKINRKRFGVAGDLWTTIKVCSDAGDLLVDAADMLDTARLYRHSEAKSVCDLACSIGIIGDPEMQDFVEQLALVPGSKSNPSGSKARPASTYDGDDILSSVLRNFRKDTEITIDLLMLLQLCLSVTKKLPRTAMHTATKHLVSCFGNTLAESVALSQDKRFQSQPEFPVEGDDTSTIKDMIYSLTTTSFTTSIISPSRAGKITILEFKSRSTEGKRHPTQWLESPTGSRNSLGDFLDYNQREALLLCRKTRLVELMAHLYAACRFSKQLDNKWQDMRHAIKDLGVAQLGLTLVDDKRPYLSMSQRFAVVMGLSQHEADKRADLYSNSKAANQRLKLPPRSTTPRPQYLARGSKFRNVLHGYQEGRSLHMSEGRPRQQALQELVTLTLQGPEQSRRPSMNAKYDKIASIFNESGITALHDVELLTIAKVAIDNDAFRLHFDYRRLTMICALLLKTIKDRK